VGSYGGPRWRHAWLVGIESNVTERDVLRLSACCCWWWWCCSSCMMSRRAQAHANSCCMVFDMADQDDEPWEKLPTSLYTVSIMVDPMRACLCLIVCGLWRRCIASSIGMSRRGWLWCVLWKLRNISELMALLVSGKVAASNLTDASVQNVLNLRFRQCIGRLCACARLLMT